MSFIFNQKIVTFLKRFQIENKIIDYVERVFTCYINSS